ncbi:MAG: response regulator [bacterium]
MTTKGKPVRILLADDDPDDRILIEEAFKEALLSFDQINHLDFVKDGEELMDYLYRREQYVNSDESLRPDLILLDLNMPRKDGMEALREIKSDPKLRCISVIILTTSKADKDIYRSYDLGANSYIAKPVTFEGLIEVMKTLGKYWLEIVELPSEYGKQQHG